MQVALINLLEVHGVFELFGRVAARSEVGRRHAQGNPERAQRQVSTDGAGQLGDRRGGGGGDGRGGPGGRLDGGGRRRRGRVGDGGRLAVEQLEGEDGVCAGELGSLWSALEDDAWHER